MLANPLGAACPCAEYQFLGATAPGQPGRQFRGRSPGTTRPNLPATASGGAAHRTLLVEPDLLTPEGIAALIQRAKERSAVFERPSPTLGRSEPEPRARARSAAKMYCR